MENRFTKSYYKIKEVSEIIGVPQSTLRFWEKEFPELSPRRSATNRRYYNAKELELLQIICFLLHVKGMKIEAAKEQLKHNKKNITKRIEILEGLNEVKKDLETLMKALNLREQYI